jgi:hypothetical protein
LQNAIELLIFLTSKKELDFELSLKLYKEGRITIPSKLFEVLQKQDIKDLITRGVFSFEQYDPVKYKGIRVFNSRIINEVKSKATNTLYEKSRLVI